MTQLKPLTITVLGALLTGAAMAVPFLVVEQGARNFRGLAIVFSVGVAFGLIMFGPMAFAERFRVAIRDWLKRRGSRMQTSIFIVMEVALGYWIASMHHHMFDGVAFVAMGLVFIGALFGIVIGIVNGDRRSAA